MIREAVFSLEGPTFSHNSWSLVQTLATICQFQTKTLELAQNLHSSWEFMLCGRFQDASLPRSELSHLLQLFFFFLPTCFEFTGAKNKMCF